MAGKIKAMIDAIIKERSQGNPSLESTTRTKLLLKGIDPSKYSDQSDDDPAVIAKIKQCAQEMGVALKV